jgi:hypothetical protein
MRWMFGYNVYEIVFKTLTGKHLGKRSFGRSRMRCGMSLIWTLSKCVLRVGSVGDWLNIPKIILARLPSNTKLFFGFLGVGWDWVHLVSRPLFCLFYRPRMINDGDCGAFGGMMPKYAEKTCSDATLFTTNPTWPDLGSNLDRRGKPATNTELRGVFRFWFYGMWRLPVW